MGCRGEVGESSSSRWQPAHSTPPAPCTKGTYRHNGHTESLLAGMYFYGYTSVSLFVLSQTAQQLRRWMILRAKYSPVNPPLTSPTLLRQAVRAFVSNNDLKKSYGEHESIHALYSSWEEKCILNRSAASNKNWPDSESTKCRVSSNRNRGEYVTTRCEQISTISKVFLF